MESQTLALPASDLGPAPLLAQMSARINRYDQAANGSPTLVQEWGQRAKAKSERLGITLLADRCLALPADNPVSRNLLKVLNPLAQNACSEAALLGLKTEKVLIGPEQKIKKMTDAISTTAGRKAVAEKVTKNFSGFLNKECRQGFTLQTIGKRVLAGQNAASIVGPVASGKLCLGLGTLYTMGISGSTIISETQKAYGKAQAQHKGSLGTLTATTGAFAGQSFKVLATWEASSLGSLVGTALCPVAGLPALVANIAVGSLFGAAACTGLSHIISNEADSTQ